MEAGIRFIRRPGARCLAPYSVDGDYYEATIVSIDANDGSCSVDYSGYDETATVFVSELKPYTQLIIPSTPPL